MYLLSVVVMFFCIYFHYLDELMEDCNSQVVPPNGPLPNSASVAPHSECNVLTFHQCQILHTVISFPND